MPSLWFVVPAHGRAQLAQICLTQLRRTCDALGEHGITATAVVIADDQNLRTAASLGFATIRRDNQFLSAKFNDGIQAALDPELTDPPLSVGQFEVMRERGYRGHPRGTIFNERLDPAAEQRAIQRGDIRIVDRGPITYPRDGFKPPRGWDGNPADYVVPIGSDDWVDWRILTNLPGRDELRAFHHLSFVREDGTEIRAANATNRGGCGIRIYPRHVMQQANFRPADEARHRACDTSILTNLTRAYGRDWMPHVVYGDQHDRQIVDWKSPVEQINSYSGIVQALRAREPADPFVALADSYPADALTDMARHFDKARSRRMVAA